MRYLVVVEKGLGSYGAYVPDLPGCVAAGESREEVLSLIREAIELHIEGLKEQGQPIPAPASTSDHVEVEADNNVFETMKLNYHPDTAPPVLARSRCAPRSRIHQTPGEISARFESFTAIKGAIRRSRIPGA